MRDGTFRMDSIGYSSLWRDWWDARFLCSEPKTLCFSAGTINRALCGNGSPHYMIVHSAPIRGGKRDR